MRLVEPHGEGALRGEDQKDETCCMEKTSTESHTPQEGKPAPYPSGTSLCKPLHVEQENQVEAPRLLSERSFAPVVGAAAAWVVVLYLLWSFPSS